MATTLQKQLITGSVEGGWHMLWAAVEQWSEYFWFLLSFVLFLLLGPFSAPIVVIAIFKLGLEDNDHAEPESIAEQL